MGAMIGRCHQMGNHESVSGREFDGNGRVERRQGP
jgi:hypothetical protein